MLTGTKKYKFFALFLVVLRVFGMPGKVSYPQLFNKQGVSDAPPDFGPLLRNRLWGILNVPTYSSFGSESPPESRYSFNL